MLSFTLEIKKTSNLIAVEDFVTLPVQMALGIALGWTLAYPRGRVPRTSPLCHIRYRNHHVMTAEMYQMVNMVRFSSHAFVRTNDVTCLKKAGVDVQHESELHASD